MSIDISFCIPVYNTEKYLCDCIESIAAFRSKEISIEIIAIDDCSGDYSFDILECMAHNIPELKVFRNDRNSGVAYTRNRTIGIAKGRYICFVDSDDIIIPKQYRHMYDAVREYNADAIIGKCRKIDEPIRYADIAKNEENCSTIVVVQQSNEKVFAALEVWAAFLRRSIITSHEITFNANMIIAEDSLFMYEFANRANIILGYESACYCYRQLTQSLFHGICSDEKRKMIFKSYVSMLDRCIEMKVAGVCDEVSIDHKTHQLKETLVMKLLAVNDDYYVRTQMCELREKGYYPYSFRMETLRNKISPLKRIMLFALPIEPFAWGMHLLLKKYKS